MVQQAYNMSSYDSQPIINQQQHSPRYNRQRSHDQYPTTSVAYTDSTSSTDGFGYNTTSSYHSTTKSQLWANNDNNYNPSPEITNACHYPPISDHSNEPVKTIGKR